MDRNIKALVEYMMSVGFIEERDEIYVGNQIIEYIGLDEYDKDTLSIDGNIQQILDALCDYAVVSGKIEDSFDEKEKLATKLINIAMPLPSDVESMFWNLYSVDKESATNYFYKLSKDSNYIPTQRVAKDKRWTYDSKYGTMDITINLSKPEKDPKDIAKAKLAQTSSYPMCLLCKENEGYAGHPGHPARGNHRVVNLKLNQKDYFIQYSPYVYYNEHCIVINQQHTPMQISSDSFQALVDFVEQFPHYFLGSNADLPIVGGSILSHDHFQGGHYTFAMEKAAMLEHKSMSKHTNVKIGRIDWPLSAVRLQSSSKEDLLLAVNDVFETWKEYSDESVDVIAYTKDTRHNTITPIARMRDGLYEMDLALRNNRTSDEYPDGIFHPHASLHHIKKENIGLIEVMGLAVLPSRLKGELQGVVNAWISDENLDKSLDAHAIWFQEVKGKYPNANKDEMANIIYDEVGRVFEQVLEDAGVFKQDQKGQEAFKLFLSKFI